MPQEGELDTIRLINKGKGEVQAAVSLAVVITLSGTAVAHAQTGPELFEHLRSACAPPITWDLLRKIAETESRFDPLAIHDNTTGKSYDPASNIEAVQLTSALLTAGHNIDAGIMQINSANFERLDLSVDAAFDPCRSIEAGAKILSMVSSYNTGNDRKGFANGYVRKVVASSSGSPAIDHNPTGRGSTPSTDSTARELNKPHQWHEVSNTSMPSQKVMSHEWHVAEEGSNDSKWRSARQDDVERKPTTPNTTDQ